MAYSTTSSTTTATATDTGGQVYTRKTCPHVLQCVKIPVSLDVFPDLSTSTQCQTEKCEHTECWVCVCCHQILCGRYGAQHMIAHTNTHSHLIAMGCGDLSFWCYGCDDYLDHLSIQPIFDFYKIAHVSKFKHEIQNLELLLTRTHFDAQNKLQQQQQQSTSTTSKMDNDEEEKTTKKEWFMGTELLRRRYAKQDAIEYDSDPEHKQTDNKAHTHTGRIIKVSKNAIEYDSDPEHKQTDNKAHTHTGRIIKVSKKALGGGGKLMVKDENGAYCNYDLHSIRVKLPPATADNTVVSEVENTSMANVRPQPPPRSTTHANDDDDDAESAYDAPTEFVPFVRAKYRQKELRKNTMVEYYVDDDDSDYAVHKARIVSVDMKIQKVSLQRTDIDDDDGGTVVTHAMCDVHIRMPSLFWSCRVCSFSNARQSKTCMVCGMLGVEITVDSQRPTGANADAFPNYFFVYGTLRDDDDSGAGWTQDWIHGCTAYNGKVCGYKTDAFPNYFFVYGTLRDDDDSGAGWTQYWTNGCSAYNGKVCGYKMYQRHGQNFPFAIQTGNVNDFFVGRLVTWNDRDTMRAKQKHADRIEGYPDFYHRTVVDVEVLQNSSDDTVNSAQHVKAFLYYQDTPDDMHVSCKEVPNGDWLQREKE
eukprot:CAMPEP_0202732694 /NCGR_PEP_ID=MMETSP1385-20130828/187791_1 /ASSEMBLY_ACC=CAM_ASM_000861 /TAXON_ID=933848 /ORGANISM="Elphidium margaritaceum" /LENGTH=642 /DNA_ID=CAMNT_0049399017 /DNA_START=35 /DNA_END=1963 /DNA_ORIENTATION=-